MTTTRRLSGMPQSSNHQQFGVMLETYEAFRKKHVAQNKEIITKNSELHKTNAGLIQERSLMQAQNLSIRGTLLQKEAELLSVRDQLWRSEETQKELREELIRVNKRNGSVVDREQVEVMRNALATALNALQAFHSLLPSKSTPITHVNTPPVPSNPAQPRPRPVPVAPPAIPISTVSRRQSLAEREIPLQPVVSQASDLSLINEGESEEDDDEEAMYAVDHEEEEGSEAPRQFNRFTPSPPIASSSSHQPPLSTSPRTIPLPVPIPSIPAPSLAINTSNRLSPPLPTMPIAKSLQPRSSSSTSKNRRVSGLIRPPPLVPVVVEEEADQQVPMVVQKKKERLNSSRVKATTRPNELLEDDDDFELPGKGGAEEIVSRSNKRRGGGRRSILEPLELIQVREEEQVEEEVNVVEDTRVEERRKRRESSKRRKSILPIPLLMDDEDESVREEGVVVVEDSPALAVAKGGSELLRARKESIRKSKLSASGNGNEQDEDDEPVHVVEEVLETVTGRRKGKGRMVVEEEEEEEREERETVEEAVQEEEEFNSQPGFQSSQLAASSQEEETGGRRARKSVNYALPKLNTKMRRPADYVPVTSAASHAVASNQKPRKSTKTPSSSSSSSSTAKSPRKSTSAPPPPSTSRSVSPPTVPSLPPAHVGNPVRQPSLAGKKVSINSKPLPQVPAETLVRSSRPQTSKVTIQMDSSSEDESEREMEKDEDTDGDEDEWNEEQYLAKMKRGSVGSRIVGGRGTGNVDSLIGNSRRRHSVAV
ncbi:hypothetical protein JCM5353_003728 [Sporobolomyces roseus]